MAGILVTRRTSPPERRMAVPVSAKGKQKPAASYSRAPRTGPTLKVRFEIYRCASFFKMFRTILKTRQTVRPTLKLASHQAFTVAFRSGNLAFNCFSEQGGYYC